MQYKRSVYMQNIYLYIYMLCIYIYIYIYIYIFPIDARASAYLHGDKILTFDCTLGNILCLSPGLADAACQNGPLLGKGALK